MEDFELIANADRLVCACIRRYELTRGKRPDVVQVSADLFWLIIEGAHFRYYGEDPFFDGILLKIDREESSMACEFPEFTPGFDEAENVAVAVAHELLRLHVQVYERTHGRKPSMLLISHDLFCPMVETPHMDWHKDKDVCLFEGINMLCLNHLPSCTVYSPIPEH